MRSNGYDGFIINFSKVDDLETEVVAPYLYHVKFSESVCDENSKRGKLTIDIPLLLDCGDGNFEIVSSDYMKHNKLNRAERRKIETNKYYDKYKKY